MKILTFIYALYMLVLPLFPCGDKDEGKDEKAKTSIVVNFDAAHQSHEEENENCSPFCNCMCCGQVITNLFYPLNGENNKKYFLSNSVSLYKNNFHSSSYLERIWQPPKFS